MVLRIPQTSRRKCSISHCLGFGHRQSNWVIKHGEGSLSVELAKAAVENRSCRLRFQLTLTTHLCFVCINPLNGDVTLNQAYTYNLSYLTKKTIRAHYRDQILMLFKGKIVVYWEKHTKNVRVLYGQSVVFQNTKADNTHTY